MAAKSTKYAAEDMALNNREPATASVDLTVLRQMWALSNWEPATASVDLTVLQPDEGAQQPRASHCERRPHCVTTR